jgi:transposase
VEGPPPADRRHPLGPVRRRPLAHPPKEFGPWQTVYDRFRKWCRNGLWDKILRYLRARAMGHDAIDWELFCIDASVIRAHQSAGGAAGTKSAGG